MISSAMMLRELVLRELRIEARKPLNYRLRFIIAGAGTLLFWKETFRRTMNRRMRTNLLVWLEYRSAWSRSGRWLIVAAIIVWESYLIERASLRSLGSYQIYILFVVALLVSITAANSFQSDRESRAFELLLVAPFTENTLLRGRIRAVWSYYRPPCSPFSPSLYGPPLWRRMKSSDGTTNRGSPLFLQLLLSS
jgi:hypothetical protein